MKHRDKMLLLNKMAKERAELGYDVINGTIGMMFLDDGHLPKNPVIREILAKHTMDDDLTYSSITGEDKYRSLLLEWFFGDAFKDELASKRARTIATIGGTGAIAVANTVENKISKCNTLFFPQPGWPNYFGVATVQQIDYLQYEMFKNGKFDIGDLTRNIKKILDEHKHVTLVINDPCQNPTGYNLKPHEWDQILELVNRKEHNHQIAIILDCAYIDFAELENRDLLVKFAKEAMKNNHVYIALSCSKTFSFYGLRIGELIYLDEDAKELNELQDNVIKTARCFWSSPNHMAMNAVIDVLSNEESRNEVREEIRTAKEIVKVRKDIFLKEADEVGLVHYPYEKGFFITLPVDDAFALSDKLIKQDIYLSPMDEKSLRVALCSMPTNKIPGLAKKIKEALENE